MDPRDLRYRITQPELKTRYDMWKSEKSQSFLKNEQEFLKAVCVVLISIGIISYFSKVRIERLEYYTTEILFISLVLFGIIHILKKMGSLIPIREEYGFQHKENIKRIMHSQNNPSIGFLPALAITLFLLYGGWKTLCRFTCDPGFYRCGHFFSLEIVFIILLLFLTAMLEWTREGSPGTF